MSLTESKIIDQITVTENGHVLYREATRIMKGGEVIAQTFHRTSLTPGQDLTGQPENVIAIAQAVWTPEIIQKYQQMAAEQSVFS
jgi:DNA-binding transcriptional LysR family regulator